MSRVHVLKVLILFLVVNNFVLGDDPITPNEKAAIKKFLPMVKEIITEDYMKTDAYLIRWIRAKKLDLPAAKEMLMKSLKWRKDNNIDGIMDSDRKSPFAKEFPIYLPGVNNEGLPYFIADWSGDLRKVALAGKRREFAKYSRINLELVERKTRELNFHNNNSEWMGIYDFNKFTTSTHLCVACLPLYLDHASVYEPNYPAGAKNFYAINAPRIFQAVLQLIGPVIRNTAERIHTFGSQDDTKKELLKLIPADQLPVRYGGTWTEST